MILFQLLSLTSQGLFLVYILEAFMWGIFFERSAHCLSNYLNSVFSDLENNVYSWVYVDIIEVFQDFSGNVTAKVISWAAELNTIIYNWEIP